MQIIHVNLGPRSYAIMVNNSAESGFPTFLLTCRPRLTPMIVVSDNHSQQHAQPIIIPLQQKGYHVCSVVLPSGENTKRLEIAAQLYDRLAEMPADRQTVVIAVGGGVVGDLAGFVAATYNRGLPLVMVPTTLLAMVDSSVGGKVGINHPLGKNLIGAFHQPVGVWIDPAVLNTLPEREYRSGLAEVVKYGVIQDAEFFEYLENHADAMLRRDLTTIETVVAKCCRLKADVVEQDEREEVGLRVILNYGHTFAHVFETVGGYGSWLHGEAVAAGMICASRLAEKLGRIDATITQRQMNLLQRFQLPTAPKPEWSTDDLIRDMYRDKKTQAGKLRFILPTRLGHVELVDDVPEALVRAVLETER